MSKLGFLHLHLKEGALSLGASIVGIVGRSGKEGIFISGNEGNEGIEGKLGILKPEGASGSGIYQSFLGHLYLFFC